MIGPGIDSSRAETSARPVRNAAVPPTPHMPVATTLPQPNHQRINEQQNGTDLDEASWHRRAYGLGQHDGQRTR